MSQTQIINPSGRQYNQWMNVLMRSFVFPSHLTISRLRMDLSTTLLHHVVLTRNYFICRQIVECNQLPMNCSQSTTPGSADEPQRKSVLFCQDCDHESPVDGDWMIRTQGDDLLYVCPTCQNVLTERPRSNASSMTSPNPVAHLTSVLVLFWLTPTIYWRTRFFPEKSLEGDG